MFRGKRLADGEWVEGVPMHDTPNDRHLIIVDCWGHHEIDPATIDRCTGQYNRNGWLIYENDICRLNKNDKDLARVCFGEFSVYDLETEEKIDNVVGWFLKSIETDALSRRAPFCYDFPLTAYYIDQLQLDVIGNNHDNPGLLQEVKA